MSLPKLNQSFNFEVTVPSLEKKFKARPYLAKEEKLLLFAAESGDPKEFLNAAKQIIANCVDFGEKYSIRDLTMFDVEYLFLKLRGFSVGEETNIITKCPDCQQDVELQINLEDVTIDQKDTYHPTINIGDGVSIKLRYLSIDDILSKVSDDITSVSELNTQQLFDFMAMVIEKVIYNDEAVKFADYSKEDQDAFLEQFTHTQLMKVAGFINDTPQVTYTHKYQHCNKEQELELRGLASFFI